MNETTTARGGVAQFITALVEVASKEIRAEFDKVSQTVADELAHRIALSMCRAHARTEIYVPAALGETVYGPRNADIWTEYTRTGPTGTRAYSAERMSEIAHARGLTKRQVRKIIAERRTADFARRQGSLDLENAA